MSAGYDRQSLRSASRLSRSTPSRLALIRVVCTIRCYQDARAGIEFPPGIGTAGISPRDIDFIIITNDVAFMIKGIGRQDRAFDIGAIGILGSTR